jgi:hypothetical protein
MTPSSNETLERIARRIPIPEPAYERMLQRRDRKRRNQRIAAGVVGIAVFVAAVWIVTSVRSLDRSETVFPGGSRTSTQTETGSTGPPTTSERSLADLPQEGAPPSTPRHGELVVAVEGESKALGRARTEMYVYADGRLIWWQEGAFPEGDNTLHEQHLTAEGVELVRSEVISSGLIPRSVPSRVEQQAGGPAVMVNADPDTPLPFGGAIAVRSDHLEWRSFESAGSFPATVDVGHTACVNGWGCVHYMTAEQEQTLERLDLRLADPASWLPASAWADQEIKTYMPSTYHICYGGLYDTIEAARILDALPGPAREPLRGAEPHETLGAVYPKRITFYCSDVTSEQIYVIVRALVDAGIVRGPGSGWGTFEYNFSVPGSGDAQMRINPLLPHGGGVCIAC